MSKLSQLKQEAYQAAKKRNWVRAVAVYERILELDKHNPTVINEFGDVCLKCGNTGNALRHFLNAASKYRSTGLLNNAVAIYKKILRYDAANLNAHWYLAETRASQGLTVEGEEHGVQFLQGSEKVSGDIKEIFLKRCVQLFELYPESDKILDRLVQIFRMWDMPLETARANCLIACRIYAAGNADEAAATVGTAVGQCPDVQNYPEYAKWLKLTDPESLASDAYAEFGQVALDDAGGAPVTVTSGHAFGDVVISADEAVAAGQDGYAADAGEDSGVARGGDADDEDLINIDDDGADFDELISAAARELAATSAAPPPAPPTPGGGQVDLLAEILADDSEFLSAGETSQLESITREIGTQVGGEASEQDAASLHEMGTVYLEMGMYAQACESFAKAAFASDPGLSLRSFEMWGVALQHAERYDEAVEVLRKGLAIAEDESPEQMGLLYNMGKSYEAANHNPEAIEVYKQILEKVPVYLDVERRLTRLVSV